MNHQTYILQVDLPDGSKVGDEYAKRYVSQSMYVNKEATLLTKNKKWSPSEVESNPAFFKAREDGPPFVDMIHKNYDRFYNNYLYRISDRKDFGKISRERLAEILIAEEEGMLLSVGEMSLVEDAFNESRLTNPVLGFKHQNFVEYLKSKI